MTKKLIVISLFIISLQGYSQSVKVDTHCIENKKFKAKYFKYINNVEAYARHKKNSDSVYITKEILAKSLKKINLFSDVNWSLLANYVYNYANITQFLEEKNKWVSWYNNNKCKNLKWH